MAGTKRFEPSEALDRAVRVFWERGFEGASYSELTSATGLNKSSLYNAFGDKQALYIKCLERFSETVGAPEMATLDRPDFADAIASFFEGMVRRMNDAASPRGCLPLTMAALELGGTEGAIGAIIRNNLQQWAATLQARCDRAVRDLADASCRHCRLGLPVPRGHARPAGPQSRPWGSLRQHARTGALPQC